MIVRSRGNCGSGGLSRARCFFLLEALSFFLGHCDLGDEVDESLAILMGRKRRDLTAVARKAFPEVFYLLDNAILYIKS
jgi:hypothetical protein